MTALRNDHETSDPSHSLWALLDAYESHLDYKIEQLEKYRKLTQTYILILETGANNPAELRENDLDRLGLIDSMNQIDDEASLIREAINRHIHFFQTQMAYVAFQSRVDKRNSHLMDLLQTITKLQDKGLMIAAIIQEKIRRELSEISQEQLVHNAYQHKPEPVAAGQNWNC